MIFDKSVCYLLSSREVHCESFKMPLSPPGKKFSCLSNEIMAYILGVVLILITLGLMSWRIFLITNKQWVEENAEPVNDGGIEAK